jgi:hypothetical protein
MLRALSVVALAILVSACGATRAEIQSDAIRTAVQKAASDARVCVGKLRESPDMVAAQLLLPLNDPSKATIEQMSSTARPTPQQMQQIVAFKKSVDSCNIATSSHVRPVFPALVNVTDEYRMSLDRVVVALVQDQINLGEAVQKAQSEERLFKAEAMSLLNRTKTALAREHAAEKEERRASMREFGDALQAANAQMQQQQQLNQQQQLINNLNRPRMTTCNQIAGIVSCNTW